MYPMRLAKDVSIIVTTVEKFLIIQMKNGIRVNCSIVKSTMLKDALRVNH